MGLQGLDFDSCSNRMAASQQETGQSYSGQGTGHQATASCHLQITKLVFYIGHKLTEIDQSWLTVNLANEVCQASSLFMSQDELV